MGGPTSFTIDAPFAELTDYGSEPSYTLAGAKPFRICYTGKASSQTVYC